MVDTLTKADRGDSRRCAARFSHGFFHGPTPAPWIRDGKMTGVTEDMLTHLLAEVYSVAYESGCQDTYEAIVLKLRARGDKFGDVLADALVAARSAI